MRSGRTILVFFRLSLHNPQLSDQISDTHQGLWFCHTALQSSHTHWKTHPVIRQRLLSARELDSESFSLDITLVMFILFLLVPASVPEPPVCPLVFVLLFVLLFCRFATACVFLVSIIEAHFLLLILTAFGSCSGFFALWSRFINHCMDSHKCNTFTFMAPRGCILMTLAIRSLFSFTSSSKF